MGVRARGLGGFSVTSFALWCGLKDACRQTRFAATQVQIWVSGLWVIFRKTCMDDSLKSAVVSWHWRKGLFCSWPQFGGRPSMINGLAISSLWETVGRGVEKYSRAEKEWEVKAVRRKGVGLLVKINWSLLQIKTQKGWARQTVSRTWHPDYHWALNFQLFELEAHWLQSRGAERSQL